MLASSSKDANGQWRDNNDLIQDFIRNVKNLPKEEFLFIADELGGEDLQRLAGRLREVSGEFDTLFADAKKRTAITTAEAEANTVLSKAYEELGRTLKISLSKATAANADEISKAINSIATDIPKVLPSLIKFTTNITSMLKYMVDHGPTILRVGSVIFGAAKGARLGALTGNPLAIAGGAIAGGIGGAIASDQLLDLGNEQEKTLKDFLPERYRDFNVSRGRHLYRPPGSYQQNQTIPDDILQRAQDNLSNYGRTPYVASPATNLYQDKSVMGSGLKQPTDFTKPYQAPTPSPLDPNYRPPSTPSTPRTASDYFSVGDETSLGAIALAGGGDRAYMEGLAALQQQGKQQAAEENRQKFQMGEAELQGVDAFRSLELGVQLSIQDAADAFVTQQQQAINNALGNMVSDRDEVERELGFSSGERAEELKRLLEVENARIDAYKATSINFQS